MGGQIIFRSYKGGGCHTNCMQLYIGDCDIFVDQEGGMGEGCIRFGKEVRCFGDLLKDTHNHLKNAWH